jgi:DNA-binding MarR family transcriptional regulator
MLVLPRMPGKSTAPYRFGDLLALARQSWITQMAGALAALGYPDYRRSDALVLRRLRRRPHSISQLGEVLGVSRQAARKVADGLERRGLATTARDEHDSRQINVQLTQRGDAYAEAVVAVVEQLNEQLGRSVNHADLAAADRVLRATLADERTRAMAKHLSRP